MDKEYYLQFLTKYAANLHSSEEHQQFLNWFHSLSPEEAEAVMNEYIAISKDYPSPIESLGRRTIDSIELELDQADMESISEYTPSLWRVSLPYIAAAMLLVIGGLSYYFYSGTTDQQRRMPQVAETQQVFPGGNRAILTLADGAVIDLNEVETGEIAQETRVQINKISDGQLVYSATNHGKATALAGVHEIRTPKAGQYTIELSDGTKVWLNAASSIRFPALFADHERNVEITGEVYFEVSSSYLNGKKVPFQVYSRNQRIEVLGTHFNVKSYKDEEEVRTTLLEGSVKVTSIGNQVGLAADSVKLKPGEQAIFRAQAGKVSPIMVKKVDSEAAVAWKTGYFKFKDTDIQEVMRQLSRWYDLDVAYVGALPQDQFTGYISKKVAITKVLDILEEGGGVKFSLRGNQVEVFNRN